MPLRELPVQCEALNLAFVLFVFFFLCKKKCEKPTGVKYGALRICSGGPMAKTLSATTNTGAQPII